MADWTRGFPLAFPTLSRFRAWCNGAYLSGCAPLRLFGVSHGFSGTVIPGAARTDWLLKSPVLATQQTFSCGGTLDTWSMCNPVPPH